MLEEALAFLEKRLEEHPAYKYEVIVVSDGSKDNTIKVAEKYAQKYGSEKVRCLELIKNRGKGGAVRLVSLNTDLSVVSNESHTDTYSWYRHQFQIT